MEITTEELTFDSEDRQLWRAFLQTRAGSRLIPKLAELCPTLLETGETNAMMVRAGKVVGYRDAINNLLLLTAEVKDVVTDSASDPYPPLTDDAKWEGPKLTETP